MIIGIVRDAVRDAYRALLLWDRSAILTATVAALAATGIIGVVTVLIPNRLFARDVPPEWWDYPVWILMSVLIGILIATYVRKPARKSASEEVPELSEGDDRQERRTGVVGSVGGVLGWFAVGCPVCNKIALVLLGYTGALTYFAPLQPILAAVSLIMLAVAVVLRLKGQYSCPTPSRERMIRQ